MTRKASSLLAILALSACLTSSSPGLAEATAAQKNLKIAFVDLKAVRDSCAEAAVADVVKAEAEAQLSADIQRSKNTVAKMRTQRLSGEQIASVQKRLQAELNSEFKMLAQSMREANTSAQNKIRQALNAVAAEQGLDLVLDRKAICFWATGADGLGDDITNNVEARLQLAHLSSVVANDAGAGKRREQPGGAAVPTDDPLRLQGLFSASTFSDEQLSQLAHSGIEYGPASKGDFLDLRKGSVLFIPESDIHVGAGRSVVLIPKGTAVWVSKIADGAAIYDLHDSLRTGRPRIALNAREFSLVPGAVMLITTNRLASFSALNSRSMIECDHVQVSELGAGIRVFAGTFSIAQGLANIPIVRTMLNSKDATQKKMAWKLIKNATILFDLAGSNNR